MKNLVSIIQILFIPLAVVFILGILFPACNADRPDLPKEYNILRFKVDGKQMENPTECGEWLNGCDPIVLDHGVSQETTHFEGAGGEPGVFRHGIYIYIYKKFQIDTSLVLDSFDRLEYIFSNNSGFTKYTNLINYHFMFTERNLEEGWLEGEFDFTVANNEGDIVEITDGYFKLTIDVY